MRGIGVAVSALVTALVTISAHAVPSFGDVRAAHRPSDITLLDRHGVALQTVRVDRQVRRLGWVAIDAMSPALLKALVLSEDKHFYEHSGVDWGAVATTAWANLWSTKTRGASTLTMQLAGLVDAGLARAASGRSVRQKIGQVLTARQLEASWSKSEILEAYLNEAPFRGEVVGIEALTQTLFGKHPSGLDAQESAIAVALVRGPNAKADVVARRACGVLALQHLDCRGLDAATALALARPGGMPLGEQLAPHFARRVIASAQAAAGSGAGGTGASSGSGAVLASRQRSTLDAALQRVAVRTLRQQLAELNGRHVEDGAVVVLDNASGEVLAWVGSSGDLSGADEVDGVLARRQPGSALKPFIYELAFEQKLITPASLIDDSPAQIATPGGLYVPQNYDHAFKGWVSARTALGASLNVPAVRVAAMLGADALVTRFNALGFALPKSGGFYGDSLALGSAEVTLLALTNAYRALANGGMYTPPRWTPAASAALTRTATSPRIAATAPAPDASDLAAQPTSTSPPTRVAAAAAAYLVTDILADNNARVRTFGLDSRLATRGFAAVKTGTSKDMRDNWCVGFTDRYTVGVWIGNASGEPMHDVSGVSGAAPIWHTLVAALLERGVSHAPRAPVGVTSLRVAFEGEREATRDEVFIAGTERALQRTSSEVGARQRFGISSPKDGSIFALDPDIPPAAQRITFEGERGTWILDGKAVGSTPNWRWAPWPGAHELTLMARNGTPLQTVRFEVRGAGVMKKPLKPAAASPPAVVAPTAQPARRAKMRWVAASITTPQRL